MGKEDKYYSNEIKKLERTLELNYEILNDNKLKIQYIHDEIANVGDNERAALLTDIKILKAQNAETELRISEILDRIDEVKAEMEHSR